jgi:hypothetical protein
VKNLITGLSGTRIETRKIFTVIHLVNGKNLNTVSGKESRNKVEI